MQRFRIKRWDYYAVFTPKRFFSATIADLGYAGNLFVYTMDFETVDLHEEGIVVPFGKGVTLPRNSTEGNSHFEDARLKLDFSLHPNHRHLSVSWPSFHNGRGIQAEIDLRTPPGHESMNIVIPIGQKRFYWNRKLNCLPASGTVKYGDMTETLAPTTSLGSLDWGRGVWEYQHPFGIGQDEGWSEERGSFAGVDFLALAFSGRREFSQTVVKVRSEAPETARFAHCEPRRWISPRVTGARPASARATR